MTSPRSSHGASRPRRSPASRRGSAAAVALVAVAIATVVISLTLPGGVSWTVVTTVLAADPSASPPGSTGPPTTGGAATGADPATGADAATGPGPTTGADATTGPDAAESVLDAPTSDVVVLGDRGGDPARLLLLRPADGDHSARLELLRDDAGTWATAATTVLPAGLTEDASGGWLLPLDGQGEAAVLVVPRADGATLARVTVGDAAVTLDEPTTIRGVIDGSVTADVDGDGTPEVVLATREGTEGSATGGAIDGAGAGACATRLHVLDGRSLAERTSMVPGPFELGPALVTDLDGRPGAELAATVVVRCPVSTGEPPEAVDAGGSTSPGSSPDRISSDDLVVVDPTDGDILGSAHLHGATDAPAAPLVVRPGPPDRPLLIVADGDSTVAVDPSDDWSVHPLIDGGSRPLAIGPPGQQGVIVALARTGTGPGGITIARLGRDADGRPSLGPELDRRTPLEVRTWAASLPDPASGPRWPQGWVGDADGDGCPELVAPTIVLPCASTATDRSRIGPPWIATRPLAVVAGAHPRLLVAAALVASATHGLAAPSPAPVAATWGGWRSGPSIAFSLGQVAAADLLYAPTFAPPTPTVDPQTGRAPLQATIAGRSGERAAARVVALSPTTDEGSVAEGSDAAAAATPAASLTELMAAPAALRLERAPVRPGVLSGVEVRAMHVPLLDAELATGTRAWRVDAITLNDWGQVSAPTSGVVRLDLIGPNLAVDPPFLSLPWPFTSMLVGRTESSARVDVDGGPAVEATRGGTFAVPLTLAPWPQDVVLRATDSEGNVTTRRLSVMGAVDLRELPWQTILVVAVTAVIIAAALRDAGRTLARRTVEGRLAARFAMGAAAAGGRNEERLVPTIEDLDDRPVAPALPTWIRVRPSRTRGWRPADPSAREDPDPTDPDGSEATSRLAPRDSRSQRRA